ncbi:MAG: nitric oxide reductase activation protein [Lachnospiraceae bacterium]|nr:nitric oxide reductase activation protein [Lachnospiraceae bacterium]
MSSEERGLYEPGLEEDFDIYRIEVENRIKNLMWTVSGDYSENITPDVDSFRISKFISLYDAIKQGAISKYFDREELSLYIVKKVFLSGDEDLIIYISQMCLDVAIADKICKERAGVRSIRLKAYDDILEHNFVNMAGSFLGEVKIVLLRKELGYSAEARAKVKEVVDIVSSLQGVDDTYEIIKVVDRIYNEYIDKSFEAKHGDLQTVLGVTIEELSEYNWRDFLKDEAYEDFLEQYMEKVGDSLSKMNEEMSEGGGEVRRNSATTRYIDQEKIDQIFNYVELNYGKSYMSRRDLERLDMKICTGAHANCKLYYTEGLIRNPVTRNYRYVMVQRLQHNNYMAYHKNHRIVKKNIAELAAELKRCINFRNQREFMRSDSGMLIPSRLWKVGRVSDANIFDKEIVKDNSEFVVEILMDASGSQTKRQESVAIQGYIISAALSRAGIPHRVMGFCSFWNYTILHRYRDYDEGADSDNKVLEYVASANNRDGLAIRAAVDDLFNRNEDNKILIVLSDGMPNDHSVAREGVIAPKPYTGSKGVKDSAAEIRKVRNMGISVLGVFTGAENELPAEKMIFGRDFAYIRNINNFSNIVSVYLKKHILDF